MRKRPRGPRSAPAVDPVCNALSALRPYVSVKTQAISYYLRSHLPTSKEFLDFSKGLVDDFLPTWMSVPEGSMLDLAFSSMALAVFSRTHQHPPAAIEAATTYDQLLQNTQMTIASLDHRDIDSYLLSIFFMGRYENIMHHPSELNKQTPYATSLRSFSHHDGASAILKTWKKDSSHGQPATNVIKHTRRGMIKSDLLRSLEVPEWMSDGKIFGEQGRELEYDQSIVRLANTRSRLSAVLKQKIQHGSQDLTSKAEMLSEEAREVDKSLQEWTAHYPHDWSYRQHTLSTWPAAGFYSPAVYSYSSLSCAAVTVQYYAARMLAISTRLRALEISHPAQDDSERTQCLRHLASIADDLASSLPFCLQKFKVSSSRGSSAAQDPITLITDVEVRPYVADLVIWPLSIASSLRELNGRQRPWFRSQLAYLGRLIGDRVLESGDADKWLQL